MSSYEEDTLSHLSSQFENMSTTVLDINKVPDEVLLKILSFVPYSTKQHKLLAKVNTRFRGLIGSSALRTEVARQQYPEYFLFRGLTTCSSAEELESMKIYSGQVEAAVDRLIEDRDKTHEYKCMKTAIIVLDYLSDLGCDDEVKNWMLIDRASRFLFSAKLIAAIRWTIFRYSELLGVEKYCCMSLNVSLKCLKLVNLQPMFAMAASRAVETTLLSGKAKVSISMMIVRNQTADAFDEYVVAQHRMLFQSMNYLVSNGSLKPEPISKTSCLRYIKGQQWRLLNLPNLDLPSDTAVDNGFCIPIYNALRQDSAVAHVFGKSSSVANGPSRDCDALRVVWKVGGNQLRKAADKIRRGQIPGGLREQFVTPVINGLERVPVACWTELL